MTLVTEELVACIYNELRCLSVVGKVYGVNSRVHNVFGQCQQAEIMKKI